MEKAITFYKSDFSEEAWELICDEFEVDYQNESVMFVADLSSVECY